MILFKCSCGTGLKVEDCQAGERFMCPACMQEITAPSVSVEDCVLIYQDGGPADGFVIDRSDLEDKITNGELGSWDLIWQGDNWIPLGRVYEFPEEVPPAVEEDSPEIALCFSDLPPVEGYSRLPGKNFHGSGAGVPGRSVSGRLFFIVKLIAVLALLCFGVWRVVKMLNTCGGASSCPEGGPAVETAVPAGGGK